MGRIRNKGRPLLRLPSPPPFTLRPSPFARPVVQEDTPSAETSPPHIISSSFSTSSSSENDGEKVALGDISSASTDQQEKLSESQEEWRSMCGRSNGKGWTCNQEAAAGYSLCGYHLDDKRRFRSKYISKNNSKNDSTSTAQETKSNTIDK